MQTRPQAASGGTLGFNDCECSSAKPDQNFEVPYFPPREFEYTEETHQRSLTCFREELLPRSRDEKGTTKKTKSTKTELQTRLAGADVLV